MTMIGHNNPPKTPFDELEDLKVEAKNWLDGGIVQTQAECDAVSKLIDMARAIKQKIDAAKVNEQRPFDEAVKAVQQKYAPSLETAKRIAECGKKAITPFMAKKEEELREKARIERAEAEKAKQAAEQAIRSAKGTSLEEREKAERLLAEAKKLEAQAAKAEKEKARGKTGGRAIGLKTIYRAELTNPQEAARHYWKARPEAIQELVKNLAAQDVRAGVREIPGFNIIEEKAAI